MQSDVSTGKGGPTPIFPILDLERRIAEWLASSNGIPVNRREAVQAAIDYVKTLGFSGPEDVDKPVITCVHPQTGICAWISVNRGGEINVGAYHPAYFYDTNGNHGC